MNLRQNKGRWFALIIVFGALWVVGNYGFKIMTSVYKKDLMTDLPGLKVLVATLATSDPAPGSPQPGSHLLRFWDVTTPYSPALTVD